MKTSLIRRLALLLAAALLLAVLGGCAATPAAPAAPPEASTAPVAGDAAEAPPDSPEKAPGDPVPPEAPGTPESGAAAENLPDASEKVPEDAAPPSGDGFSILFLDVGQADSMLVTCGDSHMLVDGGNVADSSLVASVLLSREIDTLDYVVCTHAHEDHVGGLSGALSVARAETILSPVTEAGSNAFSDFARLAAEQGTAITVPEPDATYGLGDASFQILGPRQPHDDANNTSLVLMVSYGDTRFLLTGDMERDAELELLDAGCDLQADLLKVGHHGSDTSTSYVFLNAVMPQYAVIQVGAGNDYGHPREEVLSRLRDAGVTVYRTDLQGDILVESDGRTLTVTPARNASAQTNPTEPAVDSGAYIGNLRSKKFHRPDCGSLPAPENRIYFDERAAAVAAGYDPCGLCKP